MRQVNRNLTAYPSSIRDADGHERWLRLGSYLPFLGTRLQTGSVAGQICEWSARCEATEKASSLQARLLRRVQLESLPLRSGCVASTNQSRLQLCKGGRMDLQWLTGHSVWLQFDAAPLPKRLASLFPNRVPQFGGQFLPAMLPLPQRQPSHPGFRGESWLMQHELPQAALVLSRAIRKLRVSCRHCSRSRAEPSAVAGGASRLLLIASFL